MKFNKIIKALKGIGKANESGWYVGPFSYASEYHAFTMGVLIGLVVGLTGEPALLAVVVPALLGLKQYHGKAFTEMVKEPWYCGGGIVIMYLLVTFVV